MGGSLRRRVGSGSQVGFRFERSGVGGIRFSDPSGQALFLFFGEVGLGVGSPNSVL